MYEGIEEMGQMELGMCRSRVIWSEVIPYADQIELGLQPLRLAFSCIREHATVVFRDFASSLTA